MNLSQCFRVITIFQAFWFTVSEIQRTNMGLPMTTLELTAVSFSMMMLATSITWYYKPYISEPRFIWTKHEKSVEAIREYAKQYVCLLYLGRSPLCRDSS